METTDVAIIGCGPTGAMLSAYLRQYSVKNIVLEKELDIPNDPRGIALDDEGIRFIQGMGIYDKLWTEIGRSVGQLRFISGSNRARDLHAKPFFTVNGNSISPAGHPMGMCHNQPVLEKCLRETITGHSELRCGSKVEAILEDEDFVYITYKDTSGETRELRAKFLVGADGKTGFTRKQYLELRGVKLESNPRFKYEETWVALNWKITLPTPVSHPNFPLWQCGYDPEQVYDAFFPPDFRFVCNLDRPAVCGRFGLRDTRLWRFEFVVHNGEDGLEMAKVENVKKVVYPYLIHRKERYKLKEDVAFPEDCIEVLRSRPFTFSAKTCNKWALGRVILCGDAAHVFPPFGGQGIASGFRDAISLAWRLAITTRPRSPPHKPLLQSWYYERKQQLDRSLAATILNGKLCTERGAVKVFIRDWSLWIMQVMPNWRKGMGLGSSAQLGLMRYTWAPGMPFMPTLGGGKTFPQVFCVPYSESSAMKPYFTDDVIFTWGKKSLFQLVVFLDALGEFDAVWKELQNARRFLGSELLEIDEATYFIDNLGEDPEVEIDEETYLVDTAIGRHTSEPEDLVSRENIFRIFLKEDFDPKTCSEFPEPINYDGHRLRKEVRGRYVIVRPDRFIFADCGDREELIKASRALSQTFQPERRLSARL